MTLDTALALHQAGDLVGAERLYRAILEYQPLHADALHLLGLVALQSGRPQAAADLIRESLTSNPHQPVALLNLGVALQQTKHPLEALASFDSALALDPAYADAHHNRGDVLLELARPAEALASLEQALRIQPDFVSALNNRGNALRALDRPEDALLSYEQALRLDPYHARALNNRGTVLRDLGRLEQALESFDTALRADAHDLVALHNRANALLELGRHALALDAYDSLLALQPQDVDTLAHRGVALLRLNRPDDALQCYQQALVLKPDSADVLANCGDVFVELHQYEDALQLYDAAVRLAPSNVDLLCRRASTLVELHCPEEALASCREALRLDPSRPEALFNVGAALIELRRFGEAAAYFAELIERKSDYPYARGYHLHACLCACDWRRAERDRSELALAIARGAARDLPFSFLAVSDSPAAQLQCSRAFAQERYPPREAARRSSAPRRHERIRLAYVSGDLRSHVVARLLVGIFERHDRLRFEVTAISLRPPEVSPFGHRVHASFDHFIDVSGRSDAEVVDLMREMEIDIAIDLAGFTLNQRLQIFAQRCAPVQVSHLGFPGTLGAPYIDYLIADEFIIPPASQRHYTESVVYLSECFHATDDRRSPPAQLTRAELGLPPDALVCCNLGSSFKLNEPLFDVWARLLQRTPKAVLWLIAEDSEGEANVRRHASARGLDPERLVFARRAGYDEYLARFDCADLFLDTFPFNAGATASDALWAGVPVLTCAGEAFAARMAGSMLHACGLPELVTYSLPNYEQRALELLGAPERLAELRRKVRAARHTSALFDTERCCRALESAFEEMHARTERGEAPAPIDLRTLEKARMQAAGAGAAALHGREMRTAPPA